MYSILHTPKPQPAMQHSSFILKVPHQGNLRFPSVPVFEMEEIFDGLYIMPLTRKDLTVILKSHHATSGWLVPYLPAENDGPQEDAVRHAGVVEIYLGDNLPRYEEALYVPDIKRNNKLLQAVFLIDPNWRALDKVITLSKTDFIVEVSLLCGVPEADTQLLDVFPVKTSLN
jgi:hypothetical protein